MKNLRMFLLIVCLGFSNILFSQQPIVFEKTYRTETIDTVIMALTGAQTSDGGYLLGGYAAYGMYLAQMMFFKIDSVGNYEWKKMYGSLPCSSNMIHDMEPVGDGTFICCGEGTFSTEGEPGDLKPTNSMIMRVDENANILWHKEFDAGWHECLYELALSDTGYMCVGYKQDLTKDPEHYMWASGNILGNYISFNTLDLGFDHQLLNGVALNQDDTFIAGGPAWTSSVIINFEQNGDMIEEFILSYDNQEQSTIFDILCQDENILVCGSIEIFPLSSNFQSFFAFIEYDLNNSNFIIMDHENEIKRAYAQKLVKCDSDSFVFGGGIVTQTRGVDIWLKKVDNINVIIWRRAIGGNFDETLRDVIKTSDGGYLIIGESSSFNQYTSMYVVKTDSLGLGNYTSPVENYIIKNNEFLIYPNPANDIVCIEFENKNHYYIIEIFDMSGRLVLQKTSADYQNYLNIEDLTNGLYIVKIIYENYSYQNKLIINH